MPPQESSAGKGCRKAGRAKLKCARYTSNHIREKNKLRRIMQSNGAAAAVSYAGKNGIITYYNHLVNKEK